ncbi:hypothetical protein HDE_07786 [Halotydeus destructor]|nr:hypothetical protein HDE_07786 [Halotydeus destructor]
MNGVLSWELLIQEIVDLALADLWPEYSVLAYHYVYLHVYYQHITYSDEAMKRYSELNKACRKPDYGSEILLKKQYIDVERRSHRYFGIILLAQLAYYLVNTAAIIVMVTNRGRYHEDLQIEAQYHARYTVMFLISFAVICYTQAKMSDRNEQLVLYVLGMDQKVRSGTHALIDELASQATVTGIGQFSVQPSLLLKFSGSLVSFTVLLIQIAG